VPAPFVWFDNIGASRNETAAFLAKTFGWIPSDAGQMTFLATGDEMPFSAAYDATDGVAGWVPYVEVDDLDAEVARARANGASVVAENLQGPAGVATFIRDPGGAPLAIWKRGEATR
jgi:predicted enzyme related to lactoylglutathione lyase